jgi:hypothetical protein
MAPAGSPGSTGGGVQSWIELGGGAGWGRLDCSICREDRVSGGEIRFGVGARIRPGFGFGVETSAWVTPEDPVRQAIGTVHLVGRLQPGDGPVRVQAGLGTGHYRGFESGGDDLRLRAVSAQVGVSGHLRMGPRFYLEPGVSAAFGSFGSLRRGEGVVQDRAGFHLLRAGVTLGRGARTSTAR